MARRFAHMPKRFPAGTSYVVEAHSSVQGMTMHRHVRFPDDHMKIFSKASMALLAGLFVLGIPVLAHGRQPVNLGAAGHYAILSKAGITTTGVTAIVGHIGVSPIASTAITGFGLILDSSGRFSRSTLVTGQVRAADYADPTPSRLIKAVLNMERAYDNAAGRKNPTATELGSGEIGGLVIRRGLYKWSSNVTISTNVILKGDENAVWIFQIAGTLKISSGKKVILRGGAQAKNIFWQVAGATTLATTAVFHGNILGKTGIVLQTGATLNGRALAQTAVTLDANAVTKPAGAEGISEDDFRALFESIGKDQTIPIRRFSDSPWVPDSPAR